jgi:hypothetical protein
MLWDKKWMVSNLQQRLQQQAQEENQIYPGYLLFEEVIVVPRDPAEIKLRATQFDYHLKSKAWASKGVHYMLPRLVQTVDKLSNSSMILKPKGCQC